MEEKYGIKVKLYPNQFESSRLEADIYIASCSKKTEKNEVLIYTPEIESSVKKALEKGAELGEEIGNVSIETLDKGKGQITWFRPFGVFESILSGKGIAKKIQDELIRKAKEKYPKLKKIMSWTKQFQEPARTYQLKGLGLKPGKYYPVERWLNPKAKLGWRFMRRVRRMTRGRKPR